MSKACPAQAGSFSCFRLSVSRRRSTTRLKSLELSGFKSFADRTRLEFGEGITALVGPNGSGKSNIVDALRWVFGEQNPRALRGQRWDEVIFAGSSNRRPLSIAEVTAVLDNEDGRLVLPWREVEVSRRVSRSGESEYFLNRVPCRLKDVLDLAAGATAGGSFWSYIAQAGVDEILNSRPEDRRTVIEEAAGLARFQARRQEVRRRLEEAEAAARRLDDLVAELKSQLQPVASEAALAERFLCLRRELEEVDAAVWADAAARAERRRLAAATRRERLRDGLAELDALVAKAQKRLEAGRQELARAREVCGRASSRDKEAIILDNEASSASAVLDERVSSCQAALSSALSRVQRLADRAAAHTKLLSAACEAATALGGPSGLRDGASPVSPDLTAAEAALGRAAAVQSEWALAERESRAGLSEAEGERAVAAEAAAVTERRISALEGRERALELEFASLRATSTEVRDLLFAAEERGKQAGSELQRLAVLLSENRSQLGELSAAAARLRETQARLMGEQGAHEERLAPGGGDPGTPLSEAVEARKAAAASGIPVRGPLAELIAVDQGYERAAQTVLADALCALTVPDWDTAVKLVALRESSGKGAMLALLLGGAHFEQVGASALRQPEQGGPHERDFLVSHVRSVDPEALPPALLVRLLNRWAVVEELQGAASVRRSLGGGGVVTLDGKALTPDGLLLTGPRGGPGRVLEDRSRRRRLECRLAAILSRLSAIAADLEQLQTERARLEAARRSLNAQAEALERERSIAAAEARRLAESVAREGAKQEALTAERGRIVEELGALRDRLKVVRTEADLKVQACEGLRARVDESTRLLLEAETGLEQTRDAAGRMRLAAAAGAEERRARADKLQSLEREKSTLEQDLLAAREEQLAAERTLAELEDRKRQARADLRAALAARDESARAVAIAESALRAAEGDVARLEEQLNGMIVRREEALRRLRGRDVLVERLEGDLRSLSVARNALASRFAGLVPSVAADSEALVSQRRELGDALAALGPVNLGAAEQSRRLRERLAYLSSQASDLSSSREELWASVLELDRETAKRFGEVFDGLRARFRSVLAGLFEGGQADLILTDPDSPLTSGVEILAQPPGKRLAGLAPLSGGERALTAIALLFAMAGSSASGFFVLDEVDAYLDDPNCARFCRYLQDLAYARQFLLITHNKTSMEAAGVLHGLTMEEEGVSRVVSVRLDQAAVAGGQA